MTIKLGVAGVGHPHINTIIAEAESRPDVKLMGIAERDPGLRTAYAERHEVKAVAAHDELLDACALDVVAVGDVFGHRGTVVADALRAGVHVLSDKPLCTTRDDLDAVHQAWRGSGRHLSVAFEKRFSAPTIAAMEVIASNELGDIALITATGPHKLLRDQRPDWMFRASTYGGVLNDLIVHDIDLMLRFTEARRGEVTGYVGNYGNPDVPEFEDAGLAVVHIDDGPVASLDAHWFNPNAAPYHGDYKMRIVGTEGTADLLWKDDRLIAGTHRRAPADVSLPPRRRPAEDFFDALAHGTEPQVTAADALAATSIALAAQESAHGGRRPMTWDVSPFFPDDEVGEAFADSHLT
jgi:predicted dehydrogenase